MRISILFIISILCMSCSLKQDEHERAIDRFESSVGEPELTYLNEIVAHFDQFLDQEYPDENSKLASYLTDIHNQNRETYWTIDTLDKEHYQNSLLFPQFLAIIPDSVWISGINNHSISMNYNCGYLDFSTSSGFEIGENMDSLLYLKKDEIGYVVDKPSKIIQAFESVKTDTLILNYLEAKKAAGNIQPSLLANGIKYDLNKTDDYFAKRVLIYDLNEYYNKYRD